MSIEFAEFEPRDQLPQQRELFENAFPEHRGTLIASDEHYRWKFHGAPRSPPSYEYAATEEGGLLGYYAAIPYPYLIGDRSMLAGMVCDVMTHTDARGRGVFTELGGFALGEMEKTSLDFVTGYPIRPGVMGGHLRVGWKVAFELPMYLKPLRADAILKSRGLTWLAPMANAGIIAHQAVLAPHPQAGRYATEIGVPGELLHSEQCTTFLERWAATVKNRLVKSAEFYDWRLGAPGTQYRVIMVYRGDTVVALAIGRIANLHGIPSLALLDVMVLSGEEGALPALYRDLESEAQSQGVEAIVTMMSRCRARQYRLMRFGFLKSPFTFKLILHSLKDSVAVEQISAEDDWHLMWIDSDDL